VGARIAENTSAANDASIFFADEPLGDARRPSQQTGQRHPHSHGDRCRTEPPSMTREKNHHPSTKSRWRRSILPADEAAAASTRVAALRFTRAVLLIITVGLIVALALRAVDWQASWPRWLNWLTEGGDWVPIALAAAVIAALCILSYRLRRNRSSPAVPVMIVAGLTATSLVLGFSSYWRCTNGNHPTVISPLLWTASLVKGGIGDVNLENGLCPSPPPAALELARLTIVAAIFISLVGVVSAAFRSQSDRLRAALARSVTVVVDLDDDSQSMINAIARTLQPTSRLIILTDTPERGCIQESRRPGALILPGGFDRPDTIATQKFWRRLDRLYLLSADASTNLLRLNAISRRLAPAATKRRIPMILRIDDPWLAEAWRAQQFGKHANGSDHLWAADTVSKYEVTARRLIDQILDNKAVRRLIACGTSQLTLALCAEMALRHTERGFYTPKDQPELPTLTLVAPDADEYFTDHQERQARKGLARSRLPITVVTDAARVPVVSGLVKEGADGSATAVIIVESVAAQSPTMGTRLAAKHPTTPIYTWDPAARLNAESIPVACELRTYRLGMDLPDGHAHDNFERTAMLIHEQYASSQPDRTKPASLPWMELSPFYKGSNRRQLENALWMVETIAGHIWNAPRAFDDQVSSESLEALDGGASEDAIAKLTRLGFSEDAINAMAQAEWQDWSRYLREHGWRWGPKRDRKNKEHERLVDDWQAVAADPELRAAALTYLADTQIALAKLRRLGFSDDTIYAMAQAEWEDWSRYLRKHKWTLGDKRDEQKRKHEKLVDSWEATVADPELKAAALKSLAGTLIQLLKLGYRSRGMWERFQRVGTVTAKRHRTPWSWTTASGATMHARAGDWEVCDEAQCWSVRDDIFRATHRKLRKDQWERIGTVLVRRAEAGETIHTLEGPVTAAEGDWVIQGNRGEQWPVADDEFRGRYRGPVQVYQPPTLPTPIAEAAPV
jgi:hypothetical protein